MTNFNALELEQMTVVDPEGFDDELYEDFGDVATFRVYLEPPLLERTVEYLTNFRSTLDAQLTRNRTDPSTDPDWVRRTESLRSLVSSRLHMAQGRVRAEREKLSKVGANAAAWRSFAHRMAEKLLEFEGGDEALAEVKTPFGDLNGADWLQRRLAKQPQRTGANA